MDLQTAVFITVFLSIVIGLSATGYAVWTQLIFPKHIFPRLKLNDNQAKNLKKISLFAVPLFALFMCLPITPQIIERLTTITTTKLYTPPLSRFSWVVFVMASVFLGLTSLPYLVFRLIVKGSKKITQYARIDKILAWLTFLVFAGGGLFIFGVIVSEYNNPQASEFFVLNAAIKNTCFMDPQRIGCPHNLTELSYIEPNEFARVSPSVQMIYEYYPEQNLYTFIARYSPRKAVIFDWRLVETDKIDFRTVEIETWGKDHIKNPPAFSGPWNNLPEWDK